MWRVFETFIDQFRNRNPLPYRVFVDREEVSYVPLSKKQGIFVYFSFAVFVLHTIYCFLRVVWLWKTEVWRQNQDQDLEIIRTYLLLFLTFLPLSFASMGVIISMRASIAVYIMNPLLGLKMLANEIRKRSDDTKGNLSPPNYTILINAMKFQLWLSNYPFPAIFVRIVVFQIDPLYPAVTSMISMVTSSPLIFASYTIRTILALIYLNELLKAVNAFFIVGLLVVCSVSQVIQILNSLKSKKGIWNVRTLTMREIKLYRQLMIWMEFTNQKFCCLAVPPLIFFGVSFLIFGIYGTIRMRNQVQILLYLVVPIATLLAFLFVVLLIPEAAKVFERSNFYLCRTKMDLRRGTWEGKVARSLRPLGIQIGPFGLVKNNLMKIVIRVLTEHTMTLLITF
ncbi:hypothetical protein Fcan01_10164 [Folsomia candida]|uniref:Uncharacterized protein n=1 Tax=Folsomia candida TaxID=158441 RepID=A0A226EC83_FOLCA|nr:hypothetical protein Fcan01_10164 [Folsomia candida]